mmetsp:Transcript_905/g.2810  ORF Transcript_905/g.2810 Transcript_905/m.2810 type:complete len:135 (-) Transcript_905:269-673(-)
MQAGILGAVNPQFQAIGKAFVDHYYRTFDSNRAGLAALYQGESMLTFEGEQFQGAQGIMQKLTTLQFQTVQHIPKTVDCHPGINGSIVVFVTGQLAVDGNVTTPLMFSQSFTLVPTADKANWWILNDLFRLNYG